MGGIVARRADLGPSRASWRGRRGGKYGNLRSRSSLRALAGRSFASRGERRRAEELVLLERAGAIQDLRYQVLYPLVVQGVRITGYRADFVYVEDGKIVVEDFKGFLTPEYRIKRALMLAIYGIRIRETRA